MAARADHEAGEVASRPGRTLPLADPRLRAYGLPRPSYLARLVRPDVDLVRTVVTLPPSLIAAVLGGLIELRLELLRKTRNLGLKHNG